MTTGKQVYHLGTDVDKTYYTNKVEPPQFSSSNDLCIIFDNGSYNGRAGWSSYKEPNLVFPCVVKKSKRSHNNKDILVGNEVQFSTDYTKYIIKSPFYNDVVLDYETQENIMDYMFKNLSVNTQECVDYPLLMTETLANPMASRKYMTELLFEVYGIPSLCFGVDSLFAFNSICHNANNEVVPNDALIISLSHSYIHLIPRINGTFQFIRARRLNFGGQTMHKYLSDLISFTCPTESYLMFPAQIREVLHKFAQLTSIEYFETLDRIYKTSAIDNNWGLFLQLPSISNGDQNIIGGSNKDQLSSMNSDKMNTEDNKRRNLKFYQQMHTHHNSNRLVKIQSLQNEIDAIEEAIREEDDEHSMNVFAIKLAKTQSYLDEIMIKYKRSEDFLNGTISLDELMSSANTKNRITSEEVTKFQQERLELLDKRKRRAQQKKELTKRKGCALRNKMKFLTQLAGNEDDNNISLMDDSTLSTKRFTNEDSFGLDDNDWDIYRTNINQNSDHDSEAENERIIQIENKLAKARQPVEQYHRKENTNLDDLYRIHLTTEPYRVAELLFKPFIAGLNKLNGLSQSVELLLKQFTPEEQNSMCQNIYITGGLTNIKNFDERINAEIQCVRPFESVSNIYTTYDSIKDSWDGAYQWFNSLDSSSRNDYFTVRQLYDEYGSDHPELFKTHQFSNPYP